MMRLAVVVPVLCCLLWFGGMVVNAVDRSKFRTCEQTGFCKAYRTSNGPASFPNPNALQFSPEVPGEVSNQYLKITCLATGTFRVRIESPEDKKKRWESDQVLVDVTPGKLIQKSNKYECQGQSMVEFDPTSFKLVFTRVGETDPFVILNERGMTYIEPVGGDGIHVNHDIPIAERKLDQHDGKKIKDWGEDGKPIYEDGTVGEAVENPLVTDAPTTSRFAPETFGGFTDTKPNGPMSIGFDATFPEPNVGLFGLPEHATKFSLQDTMNADPYRLYNLDVFEYELNENMALYGAVPYLLARSSKTGKFAGLFFNNPTETFVDVSSTPQSRQTRWISEAGVLEIFVFSGGLEMNHVLTPYITLTGKPALPPMYSLGYHQCRWNYRDQRDVEEVHAKFEELDFPFDVLWLDIEHTDGKRYFTWDKTKFPNPIQMQNDLARTGRRMVTIVDPHVKRDSGYYVHAEAEREGYYIKDGAQDFDGWCWSGSSSYPDFTCPQVRKWWSELYTRYEGSTRRLGIWNDMNEMSVFNGPEVTMKKTTTNRNGIEHREWHNLFGFHYHQATFEGLKLAREGDRPFVLTRAFFAGTQRFGAIWNGDNKADWGHLQQTPAMLLSMSVAGLPFVGADVGGFFGNPTTELLVRWYESASMQPFFRAHAHIETKRREPWLFGEETLQQIREVVMERYRVLGYIYTTFEQAHRTGMPVMRPMFTKQGIPLENAWLLGDSLFVCPVLESGKESIQMDDITGDFIQFTTGKPCTVGAVFPAPLGKLPVFHRVGSIVPKQMRLRRSSESMRLDPYTLFVTVNEQGKASGKLYLDDQLSFDFETLGSFYKANTMQRSINWNVY
ncbi:hypothetical protein BASA81_003297 [Batrachochytrium salamandrivorans]|nr:hypothetical protein BASA81_003297 [Batrachochytrium salamandrivorans]